MQRITKYPDLLKKVKKSRPSMDGIDTAIQKSEFLLTSVNSSVAVLEDASKTDWLLTHISSKSGGLPSDLNSVRSVILCDNVVKKKSNRALIGFLLKTNHAKLLLLLTTSKTSISDISSIFTSNHRLDMYRNIYTVSTVNAEDDLSFVIHAKEGKVSLRAPTTDQKNEWMRKIHDFS